MGLFAKAKEKTAFTKKAAKPKKNTTWLVGNAEKDAVAKAVHQIVELSAQEKSISARKAIAATIVLKHAKGNHVRDFCALGVPPDTPMLVQNEDGEKVTFVVQDRSGQYAVKEEQQDLLDGLLGEDVASDLLYTETSLGFDRTILAIPGVSAVLEKALESAIGKLVKAGKLTEDQAGELIVASQKTAFKPGTLDRAAQIVGSDVSRLAQLLDAMGSSCIRYVKS